MAKYVWRLFCVPTIAEESLDPRGLRGSSLRQGGMQVENSGAYYGPSGLPFFGAYFRFKAPRASNRQDTDE